MIVKIKVLNSKASLPRYAKPGDAGMDLTAISKSYDEHGNVSYGTGLAFEIPDGYVGLLFPRSSNCKQDLTLTNSVGVVDSGYRGEIGFKFKPLPFFTAKRPNLAHPENPFEVPYNQYEIGDRIGQIIIIPYPQIEFEQVEELSQTERGATGYGSSGK